MTNVIRSGSEEDIFIPQERQKIQHEEVTNGALAVEEDIDSEENLSGWFEGVVSIWKRTHGFIKYGDERGEDASMFFHSSAVYTNDKRAYLRRGIAVRFRIQTPSDDSKPFAAVVEGINGCALDFHAKHGELDSYDREVQMNGRWFNGTISFYSRKRMYGRIVTNESDFKASGLTDEDIEAIGDVYFKEVDIDAEDYPIKVDRDVDVRYQLFNSSRGWGAMNVQLANGNPFPMFTEADREAKRAEREARDAEKNEQSENNEGARSNGRRRRGGRQRTRRGRRNRNSEAKPKPEAVNPEDFAEFDPHQRFQGLVSSFAVHRFGFIQPREVDNLSRFGIMKNDRLCFRIQEINTEARPPMVDEDSTVTYSLTRQENGVLYAVNVSNEYDEDIVAERVFEVAPSRELVDNIWREGTVEFYNWRRGHGKITFENDDERYFFHRDDIRSVDKLPGVNDGDSVLCQKAVDSKGPAVTNIRNSDRSKISGFEPTFRSRRRNRN